ncbi:PilZ domain-containing protein [Aeromonas dhakensis]|uniref:PilZ domain-containing protein n=1 Tax=Aeromonas dhakensis TaxID=196024 RepID=UPI00111A7234|nr:PilZ domain-containing protein [Aeromonas dhakensis]
MDSRTMHNSFASNEQSVESVFPIGYDARRHRRFVLSGGGYTVMCEFNGQLFDYIRPMLQVIVRDISISGAGLLCKKEISAGRHLLIPSPHSSTLMKARVMHCVKDPLFPNLFRIGVKWCKYPSSLLFYEWETYIPKQEKNHFNEQHNKLVAVHL